MKKRRSSKLAISIYKNGVIVGETDQIYDVSEASEVVFNEILVKGDLSGVLEYNSKKIQVYSIGEFVGLEDTNSGVKGPLWKAARCVVLDNHPKK